MVNMEAFATGSGQVAGCIPPPGRLLTSFKGVVGDLLRDEADLSGAPLTITSSRSAVIRYSL